MDVFAGARSDLLLGFFVAHFSDSWIDRTNRNLAGRRISASGDGVGGAGAFLVCADLVLAIHRFAHVDGGVLDRNRYRGPGGPQCVATRSIVCLLSLFSF